MFLGIDQWFATFLCVSVRHIFKYSKFWLYIWRTLKVNTDYGKESFRKLQELRTVVTLFGFVAIHLFTFLIICFLYSWEVSAYFNKWPFPYVLTWGDAMSSISWHRNCLILCHTPQPGQFNHYLTDTIRESILSWIKNNFYIQIKI